MLQYIHFHSLTASLHQGREHTYLRIIAIQKNVIDACGELFTKFRPPFFWFERSQYALVQPWRLALHR